jgi:hypothetical protein
LVKLIGAKERDSPERRSARFEDQRCHDVALSLLIMPKP